MSKFVHYWFSELPINISVLSSPNKLFYCLTIKFDSFQDKNIITSIELLGGEAIFGAPRIMGCRYTKEIKPRGMSDFMFQLFGPE